MGIRGIIRFPLNQRFLVSNPFLFCSIAIFVVTGLYQKGNLPDQRYRAVTPLLTQDHQKPGVIYQRRDKVETIIFGLENYCQQTDDAYLARETGVEPVRDIISGKTAGRRSEFQRRITKR